MKCNMLLVHSMKTDMWWIRYAPTPVPQHRLMNDVRIATEQYPIMHVAFLCVHFSASTIDH